ADRPCRLTSPHGQRQERLSHAHEIAPPSRSPHYAARTLVGGAFSGEELNGETVAAKGEMITRLAEKRKCSGRSAYGADRLHAPFLVVGLHATIVLAVGSTRRPPSARRNGACAESGPSPPVCQGQTR